MNECIAFIFQIIKIEFLFFLQIIITVQFWLFCCPQKSKVAKLLQLKVRIRWPRNVNPKWFLRSHKANKGCCTNPTTVGEWTLVWWISRFAWIVMEPKMNFSVGLIGQFLPLEHSHLLLLRVQSMIMNDCNIKQNWWLVSVLTHAVRNFFKGTMKDPVI